MLEFQVFGAVYRDLEASISDVKGQACGLARYTQVSTSKSYTDLKKQAKENMSTAAKAEPAFLVTEKNWNGLLIALSGILDMQAQFLEQMQNLATRQELDQTLDRQRTLMQFHLEDMKARTTEFRTSIETTGTNLEKQVGKASEKFSKTLSKEEEKT